MENVFTLTHIPMSDNQRKIFQLKRDIKSGKLPDAEITSIRKLARKYHLDERKMIKSGLDTLFLKEERKRRGTDSKDVPIEVVRRIDELDHEGKGSSAISRELKIAEHLVRKVLFTPKYRHLLS